VNEFLKAIGPIMWPLAVLVGIILVFILIMSGRLKKASASKDGGIQLDMNPDEKEQRDNARAEADYFMRRRIDEIDESLKTTAKLKTQELRKPILAAVAGTGLCTPALHAIASDLRGPMYLAVDENNFKERLSKGQREEYIEEKIQALQEEYEDLVKETRTDPCAVGPSASIAFPAWPEVEPRLRLAVESWADRITLAVIDACRKKITVYQEYLPAFEDAKDQRFVKITQDCITKNAKYIEDLLGVRKEEAA